MYNKVRLNYVVGKSMGYFGLDLYQNHESRFQTKLYNFI